MTTVFIVLVEMKEQLYIILPFSLTGERLCANSSDGKKQLLMCIKGTSQVGGAPRYY